MPDSYQLYNALKADDNKRIAEIIYEHGFFSEVVNGIGWTATHYAARDGDVQVLQKIWRMRPQPPIGQKKNDGRTALHTAAFCGELESTQWLVGHGIDPQAVDKNNETAKDLAKSRGNTKVEKFLEKIESMSPEMFPVKHPSPLNSFAITNDVKGLEEFFSQKSQTDNDGTVDANSEVITYVFYIVVKFSI